MKMKKMNLRKKAVKKINQNIYVLPNLLTTGNLFFGFYAIIHAIKSDFIMACYAIVAAAVFDLLDGRVARMTHSESKFGEEYDSLCDLISFGMAPAILLYQWSLFSFGRIGWLAAFFYVACAALRLARFNVSKEVVGKSYFQGLPSPMAAGIVASAVMAFNDLGWHGERSELLLAITLLLGFVMVTSFRYRSFKDLDLKERLPFKYLVIGVFIVSIIAIHPEVTLFVLFLTYAILGAVFGVFRIGKVYKSPLPEEVEEITIEHDENDSF